VSPYFVTANFGAVIDGALAGDWSTRATDHTGLQRLSAIVHAIAWSIVGCGMLAGKSSDFGNAKFFALQTNARPELQLN
jgi:hypothetical protein